MASAYQTLLDATVRHLEDLRAEGVKHVAVSTETLAALARPQRRAAAPAAPLHVPVAAAPAGPAVRRAPMPAVVVATPAERGVSRPSTPSPGSAPASALDLGLASSPVPPATLLSPEAKAQGMAELRQRAEVCVRCPHLASSRRTVVFGVGDIHSPLMFVGEAPGADEDEQGEPFVGKAGQLLTRIIQTMGLSRDQVFIANILKCRPDTPGQAAGNRKPTPEEMATCLPYLLAQIDLIQPKVLVALGATAVEGLLGKTLGITKLRGQWRTFRNIPLMPTYHPAYLLRNQSLAEKRRVWEDMLQVMERLGMSINEKQRQFFLKP